MQHIVSASQRNFAKSQRANVTALEQRLWKALRARRCEGWKFRRQVPLGRYVVDFVCFEARLIVEADGPLHESEEAQGRDAERDRWLRDNGFAVLRLTGDEIVGDLGMALRRVESALEEVRSRG